MDRSLVPLDDIGTLAWLEQSSGHLTRRERSHLLRGMFPMIRDGFRLRRAARRSRGHLVELDPFQPPATPMVIAAREYLKDHGSAPMINHVYRTAFWTLVVLGQHGEVTPEMCETAWVAALLHDLGLDVPSETGDFSSAAVAILRSLAHRTRWSEEQTEEAGQAIALNLTTRADPARHGKIAWAMNVGGAGELGIWPHRGMLARSRIAELELRYPRTGFRSLALELIRAEVRRVPDGRFAVFRPVYWLLMR